MAFDPMVEAIRSALRSIDRDPKSVPAYLKLIDAYEICADKESEPELLEQAGYVIRDVKGLPMSEEQKRELSALEERISATLARIHSQRKEP